MKQAIYLLSIITVASAITVAILYSSANERETLRSPFIRTFRQRLVPKAAVEVKSTGAYIAGFEDGLIYLGSKNPYQIQPIETEQLKQLKEINLQIESKNKVLSSRVIVDGFLTYVHDLQTNLIYRGKIEGKLKLFSPTALFITEVVPLDSNTFVIRTLKERQRELLIAKLSGNPSDLEYAQGLLQKQVDGVFCTDGKLLFSKSLNSFIYVYFYRNEFIRFDTALNLQSRNHTIDTFSRANIHVVRNPAKDTWVISGIPPIVNQRSYVNGTMLFVNSNVVGSHEDSNQHYDGSVIDAYNLKSNTYENSFFIPDYNGMHFNDFVADHNVVYALYKNFLVSYSVEMMEATIDHE